MENVNQANVENVVPGVLNGKRPAEGEEASGPKAKAAKKREEEEAIKHKTYSEAEKELVVASNNVGGAHMRHEIARMLSMPKSTADHIVRLYDLIGKEAFHDHRASSKKAPLPLTHLTVGHGAKKNSQLVQMISRWIHFDADLTWETIRELVNLEIFRKICADRCFLQPSELVPSSPISESRIRDLLKDEHIKEEFNQRMVHNQATIAGWMDGIAVSRKYHLHSNAQVNHPENILWRHMFAKDLMGSLKDPNALVVFVDQIPIWLHSSHVPESAPESASGKSIHQSVIAYMAVDPQHGVIAANCFENPSSLGRHDVPEQKKGMRFNRAQFDSFLNEVSGALSDREDVGDKNIFIVTEIPEEYAKEVVLDSAGGPLHVKGVPNFDELQKRLNANAKSITLVKQPPSSPTLNFAEFLNFELLSLINERLHELVLHEKDHEYFLAHAYGPGRPNILLDKVTMRALRSLSLHRLNAQVLVELTEHLADLIASDGVLDLIKTMNRFDKTRTE